MDDAAVLARLPPLPERKLRAMRGQSAMGTTTVLFLTLLYGTMTHVGVYLMSGEVPASVPAIFLVLFYVHALLANVCLLGLLWGDPGELKRSAMACLPVPEEVWQRLNEGGQADQNRNITQDDRVYCVRCHLWRDEDKGKAERKRLFASHRWNWCCGCLMGQFDLKPTHHCSICQRCVVDFDHHCGFFGRCIAGRGFSGNMGYFKTIIGTGYTGGVSAVSGLIVGMATSKTSWGRWAALGGAAYAGLLLCVYAVAFLGLCIRKVYLRVAPSEHRGRERLPDDAELARHDDHNHHNTIGMQMSDISD